MVEKVKGISRVKEVQYNVNLQTEERRNGGSGQSFQDSLQQAMQQKRRAAALSSGMTVTEPYALDVSRATQSLFYASPSLLDELDVFSRIS